MSERVTLDITCEVQRCTCARSPVSCCTVCVSFSAGGECECHRRLRRARALQPLGTVTLFPARGDRHSEDDPGGSRTPCVLPAGSTSMLTTGEDWREFFDSSPTTRTLVVRGVLRTEPDNFPLPSLFAPWALCCRDHTTSFCSSPSYFAS